MRIKSLLLSYLLLLSLASGVLRADDLSVSLEALKVTRGESGEEVLTLADTAGPGALIEYRAVCKNSTDAALSGVFTEIPVPEGLILVASSDQPKATDARLADNRVVALPALDAEGQPLPIEQIRALRWKIENIPAGESIVLSLRASVTR